MTVDVLEHRYRSLLRLFPGEHRRFYEEEMVGVLMSSAREGQRRPGLADTADLVLAALRARLGRGLVPFADPHRAAGAAVFGLFAAVLLAVRAVRWPLQATVFGFEFASVQPLEWAQPALWLAAVVLTLIGWRIAGAVAAWAAAATAFYLVSPQFGYPAEFLAELAGLLLGVLAAAALSVPAPRRQATGILGRVGVTFLAGGAVLAVAGLLDDPSRWAGEDGSFEVWTFFDLYVGNLGFAAICTAAVAMLVAAWRTGAAVRLRLLAWAAPLVALTALIDYGFAGYLYSSSQWDLPIPLTPVQWGALVVVPLLAFVVAHRLVRAWERAAHLIALGREADRALAAGERG